MMERPKRFVRCMVLILALALVLVPWAAAAEVDTPEMPVCYAESAWGAESTGVHRFVERGNWATYFHYQIDGGTEAEPEAYPLLAGQTMDAGTVYVWNDGTHLWVKYVANDEYQWDEVDGSWKIMATHLHVAQNEYGVPRTEVGKNRTPGGPIPGHFTYKSGHYPDGTDEVTHGPIPLTGLSGTIVIAAHAEMMWCPGDHDEDECIYVQWLNPTEGDEFWCDEEIAFRFRLFRDADLTQELTDADFPDGVDVTIYQVVADEDDETVFTGTAQWDNVEDWWAVTVKPGRDFNPFPGCADYYIVVDEACDGQELNFSVKTLTVAWNNPQPQNTRWNKNAATNVTFNVYDCNDAELDAADFPSGLVVTFVRNSDGVVVYTVTAEYGGNQWRAQQVKPVDNFKAGGVYSSDGMYRAYVQHACGQYALFEVYTPGPGGS